MNYKNILLNTLLLTVSLSVHARMSNEAQIQNLEVALLKKMHEVSELGAKIDEKQKLLESIWHDMQSHLSDRITLFKLEGDAIEEFINTTYAGGEHFKKITQSTLIMKNDPRGVLLEEFFNEETMMPDCFEAQKFWAVRGFLEYQLLKKLVEKYEACIEEMHCIIDELEVIKHNKAKK